MNPPIRAAIPELARVIVAVVVAVGGSFGYLELAGPGRMLRHTDSAQLQAKARPDPWRGVEGRANTAAITKMAAAVSEIQLTMAAMELRVTALEGKDIPPKEFQKKVERIEHKLDKLTELVTELRIVVGRMFTR